MSDTITLSLRDSPEGSVEVDGLTADRLAGLSNRDIAARPAWIGKRVAQVGDFFNVTGERSTSVRIEGALDRFGGIGAGMRGGEILIDGDVGGRLGAGMTAGTIDVRGRVGDEAGLAMRGGVIHVTGDAGDRLGAAAAGAPKGMTGGEIIVDGSAGAEAAARARRGLVVIGGNVGELAGWSMIAGTLMAMGDIGANAGRLNKRGSIVALGHVEVPVTYRYACTFQPPHVRLTIAYLRRRYGLAIDERALAGRYRRYCGDAGNPGRGEILRWVSE